MYGSVTKLAGVTPLRNETDNAIVKYCQALIFIPSSLSLIQIGIKLYTIEKIANNINNNNHNQPRGKTNPLPMLVKNVPQLISIINKTVTTTSANDSKLVRMIITMLRLLKKLFDSAFSSIVALSILFPSISVLFLAINKIYSYYISDR
ncbi:MAG: hypothetical protein MJ201_04170 [Mycoplasmoidaceae bacterium]|nr:hypothetical protein [Mycoplasmoidaceae bacterium]